MKGMSTLIRRTTPSSFAYICEKNGDSLTDKVSLSLRAPVVPNLYFTMSYINCLVLHLQMDELACFAPGMLALGSFGYGPDDSQKFLSLAEEVFLILENK